MRKIVQIANAWSPADDCIGIDATDQLFALDNDGVVWKGEIDFGDSDYWRRLAAISQQSQIIQISVSAAPRDRRLDSVAMERVFALCDDGSVWLKSIMLYCEQPWTRLADIPQRRIVQISTDWAAYQASEGTCLAPLEDSVDRLLALCSDGTIWLYHPYAYWRSDDTSEPPHWDRLPDLPPDP